MANLTRAALLIALTYTAAPEEFGVDALEAPRHDLQRWITFLQGKGITDITVVTDTTQWQQALGANIRAALDAFVEKTARERLDFAFVYYAGHGAQLTEPGVMQNELPEHVVTGMVAPGRDEAIVPLDANVDDVDAGPITDDEIALALYNAYPACHITVVFDCCNSATLADLQFEYASPTNFRNNPRCRDMLHRNVVAFTGCKDKQLSFESTPDTIAGATGGILPRVTLPNKPGGFLSCVLIDALLGDWDLNRSVLGLFQQVRTVFQRINSEVGTIQDPQLNASRVLTANDPFILE
jgi:hypothetical protein